MRILAAVGIVMIMGGCARNERPAHEVPVIGFAINTLNNPFFVDMKQGAEKAAKAAGVEVLIQATEREMDVEKQVQIIENLLQMNVQVLCITPNGAKEVIPAITKANRTNIPVIVVDSRVDLRALHEANGWITSFVGSDNVEGGRLAGEYIVRTLRGNGNVAILEGPAGHETSDSRLKGFHEALDPEKGMKIVSSQLASFDRSQGYSVFQNVLQAHPNIHAVFACNDLMALGAIEAVAAAGKTGRIVVVGFDAIDDARRAIKDGSMDATIAQYPNDMGFRAVEAAAKALKGEQIPKSIATRIELITKDNVDASKQ